MRILQLIILVVISFYSFSQNEPETLFSSGGNTEIRWYVMPSADFTVVDQNYEALISIESGINLNRNYLIGVFYSTVISKPEPEGYSAEDGYKNFLDMAGLSLSYMFNRDKIIHPVLFVKSGVSNFAVENTDTGIITNFTQFLFIPGISFDINLTKNISLGLQSSFRILPPVDLYQYKSAGLSGSQTGLSIIIGNF